jgi:hypothetical protein
MTLNHSRESADACAARNQKHLDLFGPAAFEYLLQA